MGGIKKGKCSSTRKIDDLKRKALKKIKSTAMKAVAFFLQKIFQQFRKHMPCSARPQMMYVLETLVKNGQLNLQSAKKAFEATKFIIVFEMVPATVKYIMGTFAKIPQTSLKIQDSCQRARFALDCGEVFRVVASPDQIGGEDWHIYPKPDVFTFYLVRASRDYFNSISPHVTLHSNDCLLPGKVQGCKTPEMMFNASTAEKKFKPRCIMQVSIKMKSCNTCCCKKSGTVDSSVTSSLRFESDTDAKPDLAKRKKAGQDCSAYFSMVDGIVRSVWGFARNYLAVSNFYSRCWRGTKPYRKKPTSYMKKNGSACQYFR